MSEPLTQEALSALLAETWKSHSEFQENYLDNVRDEMWAGWYAAYLIGRLGPIMPPSRLTRILESVQAPNDRWTDTAAADILKALAEY